MPSTYLAHHGILNQKWGVRRFQNKDGTLTEAGKKRYRKLEAEMKQLKPDSKGDSTESHETESAESPKPKRVSEMTDQDLKALIARMENEKKYRQLYNELNPPPVRGKSVTQKYLEKAGSSLADALIKEGSTVIAKKLVAAVVGNDSSGDSKKKSSETKGSSEQKESKSEKLDREIKAYDFDQRKKAVRTAAREERKAQRESKRAATDAYYERKRLEADQRNAKKRAAEIEAYNRRMENFDQFRSDVRDISSMFANRYLIESEDDKKKRSRRRSYYDMFG